MTPNNARPIARSARVEVWTFLLALLSLHVAASAPAAKRTYDSGFEPKPLVPFPAEYKDYQILPRTVSPNRKFAFIYPKRSRLYRLDEPILYLVALSPFRIISQVSTGDSNLAANAHGYYAANWAKNSTAAVFVAGSKWGPDKVSALLIRDGKVAKQDDLTAAVRKQVLPDFQSSRANRYNEYYDFIFESDDRLLEAADGNIIAEHGWDPDQRGRVSIDCLCTTDPKEINPKRWKARFQGTWNIATGRFITSKLTRLPPSAAHRK